MRVKKLGLYYLHTQNQAFRLHPLFLLFCHKLDKIRYNALSRTIYTQQITIPDQTNLWSPDEGKGAEE